MRVRFDGSITGVGFASGDRFVVGLWKDGPLGPMADVMWARPDDRRILLAPRADVASFIAGVYRFDEVHEVPFAIDGPDAATLRLRAGPLELDVRGGNAHPLFALRPRWLRRRTWWVRVEDALLRPLVGPLLGGAGDVRTYGEQRGGVREWYAVDAYRPVDTATARVDGSDLGGLADLEPVDFGFSGFPRRPAIVRCAPVLDVPDRVLPRRAVHAPSGP